MPRIELTGEREAQSQYLQSLRRRRIIDAATYRAAADDLIRKQTVLNARAEKARTTREAARVAREAAAEAARVAAEAAREEARKERRRLAQRARREAAREAARIQTLRAYPSLGRELIRMSAGSVELGGEICNWVLGIPATRFTIRCEYGFTTNPVVKLIEKTDEDTIQSWWIDRQNFWKLMTDSEQTIFNKPTGVRESDITASMSVVVPTVVQGVPAVQRLRAGEEHCIFSPLKAFYEKKQEATKSKSLLKQLSTHIKKCDKLAVKYDAGITLEELERESASLDTTLYVYRVDRKTKVILNPKKKWSFSFLNTQYNHCDVFLSDSNAIEMTPREMTEQYQELLGTNASFAYESSHNTIRNIEALGQKYRLKTPYEDMFKEFNESIGKQYFGIDYVNERAVFNYILQASKHNTHMSFRDLTDVNPNRLKEVDCKAGYTQFKKAPCYRGFLGCVWDWCDKGESGLPLTLADIKKHVGIYTIRITRSVPLLEKAGYVVGETFTITSPFLEYLLMSNDIGCDILYGVYGSKVDFEFPKEFLQKYDEQTGVLGDRGVPLYSIWCGMNAAASDHRVIRRRIDYRLVQELKAAGEDIYWEYDDDCYDLNRIDGQWVRELKPYVLDLVSPPGCSVQYIPKTSSPNCPQIFAFITDYMRMNMIHEMKRLPMNDIYAWKVDSIVYTGTHVFRPMFRPKEVKIDFLMSDSIFRPSQLAPWSAEALDVHPPICRSIVPTMTLFSGGGGSGKSHYAATIRKLLYVAPMWSMCVDFKTKYNAVKPLVLTPYQVLGTNGARSYFETTQWRPGTLYCDEATMLEQIVYDMITKMPGANHMRILFGGDFDDKGRPFQTTFNSVMNVKPLRTKLFPNDYRCVAGDALVGIKQTIRDFMYAHYGDTAKLVAFVKDLQKDRIISRADVPELYGLEDWILTGTIQSYTRWTEQLRDKGEKYIVTKHTPTDVYAALNGEDVALNGDIIHYDNGRCELRHAFTIHSAQGKTITDTVFIDMERMDFDYCLLYTAISRAKTLDQIYLVV